MGNTKQATCRVQSCCFAPCYFAWHLSPPEEAPPPALLLLHRSREDASPVLRQTRVTDVPPRVTVATLMPPNSFAKLPIPTPDAAAGREASALPVPLKTRVKTASTPRVTVVVLTPQPIAKKPLFRQPIREDASPVLRQTRVMDVPPRVTVATRMSPNSFAKLPIPTPDAAAGKEESVLPVHLKTRVKTASTPRVIVATQIQPNSFAKQPLQSPTPAMTGILPRRAWSRLVSKGTPNVVAKPAQKSAGTHGARTTVAMAITQHVFWTTLSRAQSTFTHDASAMWR